MKKECTKNISISYIIIFVLFLGLFVRLWGISFGLPYLYHVDEDRFAKISLRYFTGDLNPHFFHVPSLHGYFITGIWKIYFFIGKIFGEFHTQSDFIESFNANPTSLIFLGRLFSALLAAGTILIVYLLGTKII